MGADRVAVGAGIDRGDDRAALPAVAAPHVSGNRAGPRDPGCDVSRIWLPLLTNGGFIPSPCATPCELVGAASSYDCGDLVQGS